MATMKELREKLKQEAAKNNNKGGFSDNTIYPFWNIEAGGTPATVRFLADADPSNIYFWRERLMINLEFAGIAGTNKTDTVRIQVPSMEMWGEKCPILTEARAFYKQGKDELGRKYWKKKSFIFQGFVRNNPISEENPPENPIRKFVINPKLNEVIRSILMDEDLEVSPTDVDDGIDFKIAKTQNGQYADYTSSSWARKSSSLNEEELKAIEEFGLFNLNDFLPKKPDEETLEIIQQMFEASLDGDAYDASRFANFYKPYGLEVDADGNVSAANLSKASKDDDDDDAKPARNTTSSKPKASVTVDEDEDSPLPDVSEGKLVTKTSVSPQELLKKLQSKKS